MLRTNIEGQWPLDSEEEHLKGLFQYMIMEAIMGHNGHLNKKKSFRSPHLERPHIKYGCYWPSGFKGENV